MVGGAGTSIFGGKIDDLDPNLNVRDNWLDDLNGTWGLAKKMMLDGYVGQAVEGVTDTIYGADHDFEPGDDSPLAREVAEFCRHAFIERLNWTRLLESALYYLRDGVSLIESTDDVRVVSADRFPNHPQPGAAILYTDFQHRPAGTIDKWVQNKQDPTKLSSVTQYIHGSDVEQSGYRDIPVANKILRFTWMQEAANFLGNAPLRRAFGAWYRKVHLVAIAMIAHERHHIGIPTVVWNEQALNLAEDEIEKVKTMLLNMRAHEKSFMLLPPGVKDFNFKSAAGGTDIENAIKEANYEIMHTFAGGWQLLGSGGGNGSYALAQTQQGRPNVVTHRHIDFIDDVFNHGADGWSPVERLVVLNYGPNAPIPRKVTRNIPTVDYKEIAKTLPTLIASNIIRPDERLEEVVRKWMLLPARDEATTRGADDALNGAQLSEQRSMIQAVVGADGRVPPENAVNWLVANFGLDQATAEGMVPSEPPPVAVTPQQLTLPIGDEAKASGGLRFRYQYPIRDGAKDGAEEDKPSE